MMPNVGPLEILLVLIVALVVFGPKKLPDLGHSLGKGIREFKGSVTGETDEPARVETHAAPVVAPVAHAAPVAVPVDRAKAPQA
jgi:sec-independent protein translocase protein TatA